MWTEVIEITPNGLLLNGLDPDYKNSNFWLPASEWSDDYEEWEISYETIEIGDCVDVVIVKIKNETEEFPIVSRKRFTFSDIEDNLWIGAHRIMTVEEYTRTHIKGKVGTIEARISRELYDNFLTSKQLNRKLIEHSFLSRGDNISGTVIDINKEHDFIILDPEQYLAMIGQGHQDDEFKNQDIDINIDKKYKFDSPSFYISNELIKQISPMLLVENHNGCRESIEAFLKKNGIAVLAAETFQKAEEIISSPIKQGSLGNNLSFPSEFRMAIIDPNLENDGNDFNGLRIARKVSEEMNCRVLIITGEIGNDRKLKQWGNLKVHGFLEKPFTMDMLIDAAKGCFEVDPTPLKNWIEPIYQLEEPALVEQYLHSEIKISDLLHKEVQMLTSSKPDSVVAVFKFHRRSLRPSLVGISGHGLRWEKFLWKVSKSPIKDAAYSNKPIYEPNASMHDLDSDDQPKKHYWTRRMMNYESFYGIKLNVDDIYDYSMVVFHHDKDAFDQDFKYAAQLLAERLTRLIEKELLLRQRESEVTFAATGLALECLGHELSTELTAIAGQFSVLLSNLQSPNKQTRDVIEWTSIIYSKVSLMVQMSEALRGVRSRKTKVSVYNCLQDACKSARTFMSKLPGTENIHIETLKLDNMRDLYVNAAPAALRVVFFNVYLNAIQQLLLVSRIRKACRIWHAIDYRLDKDDEPWIIVRIRDNGPGIHKEDFEKVKNPGFTTKEEGTGLGLWICQKLINNITDTKKRKGSITVTQSVILDGTTFTIKLPIIS